LQALEGHEGSSSEDEDADAAGHHSQGPTYVQEQQQLRQAFLQVLSDPITPLCHSTPTKALKQMFTCPAIMQPFVQKKRAGCLSVFYL